MKQNIEIIISNTLTNIYDWESDDLKSDFISFLNLEYGIEEEKLSIIFDKYDALSPSERDSISFDVNHFVQSLLH